MRNSRIRWLGILLALHLSGCESIKSFFPDKMQDYRYSREIPPLELPPDLKSESIKTDDDIHPQAAAPAQSAPSAAETPSDASREMPAPQPQQTAQSLVAWSDGGSRLQINKPFDKAWFVVSKALTHNAIEITDYDRSQGVFFVQYDPEKYEIRDGSVWDEVAFFFGARNSHEMPYRVRVIDAGAVTTVVVTDESDVPITQGPGFNLTKLLYDTIEAEGKEKPEGEETEKTGEEQPSDTEQQKDSGAEANPAPERDGQRQSGAEGTSPADSEKP